MYEPKVRPRFLSLGLRLTEPGFPDRTGIMAGYNSAQRGPLNTCHPRRDDPCSNNYPRPLRY